MLLGTFSLFESTAMLDMLDWSKRDARRARHAPAAAPPPATPRRRHTPRRHTPEHMRLSAPEAPPLVVMNRIVGAAEAAAFCTLSLSQWRRLPRAGAVPPPIRLGLGRRKLGWRLGALIDFLAAQGA